MCPTIFQESSQLSGWFGRAFKRGVDQDKIYYFVEDLAEVAHLVFHHIAVTLITVETEDAQFALHLLFESLRTRLSSQIE